MMSPTIPIPPAAAGISGVSCIANMASPFGSALGLPRRASPTSRRTNVSEGPPVVSIARTKIQRAESSYRGEGSAKPLAEHAEHAAHDFEVPRHELLERVAVEPKEDG